MYKNTSSRQWNVHVLIWDSLNKNYKATFKKKSRDQCKSSSKYSCSMTGE